MLRLLILLIFALLTVESFNTTRRVFNFSRYNRPEGTDGNLTEPRGTIQPMKKSTTMPRTTIDMDEEKDDVIDDEEKEVIYDGINTDDVPNDSEPEEMDAVGPTKYDEQLRQLSPSIDPTTKRANMLMCFKKNYRAYCYVGDGCLTNDQNAVHTKLVRLEDEHEFNSRAITCDVAVVIHRKSDQIERGHRIVEYHTTNKYLNLTVPLSKSTIYNYAVVKDGELRCVGTCSIYHRKPFYNDSTSYYFRSNFYYWEDLIIGKFPEEADLAWCFKRLDTRCFIGDGCLIVSEDMEEEHKTIIFVTSELKEMILSNYSLRYEAEECNVGASFVPTDNKGKYSFSFHTKPDKRNLVLTFNNREIAINKNGTLTCSSKLANKGCKIQTNPIPGYYRGLFFTGEIYLFKNRTKDAKVNHSDSSEKSSTKDSKSLSNVKHEEIKKEKESNIGTITLVAISALFACIIIAIIGGIMYRRVTTARNNRKRAEIEATIKPPEVEKAPPCAVPLDKIPIVKSDPTSEISARGD
ncbi:hypothetical protein PRIPAC_84196 [Pristionchus pacificus]|nr:hypothetical protein PRIPAC_84196 [Pristionchus pacificus]